MSRPEPRLPGRFRATSGSPAPGGDEAEPVVGTAPRRRRRRRRVIVLSVLGVVVLLLAAAAWVGTRAWSAKGELEQAEKLVPDLRAKAGAGDLAGAVVVFGEIRTHAATARGLSEDRLWAVAEHLPVLGPNLSAVRELTAVVDAAMTAGAPLVDLAPQLAPSVLATYGGVLPLDPVAKLAERISPLATELTGLSVQLAEVDTTGTVHQLQDAKRMLTGVLASATTALNGAAPLVHALPALLGESGPRTYVVMFLNNTELRSLGGTALAFAEISVDHGAITLTQVLSTSDGPFVQHPGSVITMPDGFDDVYPGALGVFVANATLRPSAVTAAQIVEAEWSKTFGRKVDGVISMDAGALGLLMKAVGPVTISTGDVVSSKNVVSLLFNEVLTRYNTGVRAIDDPQQGLVFAETVNATFAKLMSGQFDPKVLLASLTSAADERRFSVWFADPGEHEALATTAFDARDLPESTPAQDVVGVYLNDQVGSHLEYYLDSTVTTGSAVCTADGRQVGRVTVALTNALDPAAVRDLSPSITGGDHSDRGLAKGEVRLAVFVYLPEGATLLSASLDGSPVAATGQVDSGRPVQVMWVQLMPGATGQLSVDVLMGAPGTRALGVEVTPTINGTQFATTPLECGTVALP